jgi:CheY-like chemotaxis protein
MSFTRILVAEDNPLNRELLREILESESYEVIEAENGQEALAKLNKTLPDLILLDINMPTMDGFAVIRAIREDPRWDRIPVLAVTAYAMRHDRVRVLAAGFDGYLAKPIESSAVIGAISGCIGSPEC